MVKLDETNENNYKKVATKEAEADKNEKQEVPKTFGYGVRHVQVLLIFAAVTVTFIARAHVSVTIVAMTDVPKVDIINTNISQINIKQMTSNNNTELFFDVTENTTVIIDSDNFDANDQNKIKEVSDNRTGDIQLLLSLNATNNESKLYNFVNQKEDDSIWNVYRTYDWSKSTQEMILGSFFLGYLIMMSPMGLVCQRWGGKLPLQISLFSSAVVTFFTPWLAVWGNYKAVCLTRVATGLVQAGTYPSLHSLIAKWVPTSERGRLGTYIYTGSMVGAVLGYHVSGFLAASVLGWPSIYWVIGVMCFVMAVLITLFVTPSPQQHPRITQEEKNFILGDVQEHVGKRRPTPWKAIFTSVPVWVAFIAHMSTATIYLFYFSQIPTYLHHVVGLNIKNSGLLSSLPYFANFLASIALGNLCDYAVNRNIATLKTVRIVSNSLANIGSGLCLVLVSFTTNTTLAVTYLALGMGLHAGTHTGWMMSYIDMSPNFSGALMATGNTLMNLCACSLSVLVSYIVTDMSNVLQWRIVLFAVAGFGCAGNAVYMMFMSADIQPFNDISYESTGQEDPEYTEKEKQKEPLQC